ncbi:MAG: multiheme c-type cytochrome, partial [Planctomycetota bacterium]
MNSKSNTPVLVVLGCLACFSAGLAAQRGAPADGSHFRVGRDCSICHSVSPTANAMRSATGDDVSPHGLWQSTMMANSFRDPYFRAQLERESKDNEAVQELCLRCHAPMAHHERAMAGQPHPRLKDLVDSKLARDGVSCTVCHQITSEGLGTEAVLSGRPVIGKDRTIFGPFADPAQMPMRNNVGYTPVQSPHVRTSALCGTCHTLTTEHHGTKFPEQTPFLEWRNSEFSDEGGATETSRTCQECHMPATGST